MSRSMQENLIHMKKLREEHRRRLRVAPGEGLGRLNRYTRGQLGGVLDDYSFYLVLGVIGLIAAIVIFGMSMTSSKAQSLSSELQVLIGNVDGLYSNQFGTISNASLDKNGAFNGFTTLTDHSGAITVNPGGGQLTVTPGTLFSANDSVQYEITNLPNDACRTLVTSFSQNAGQISLNSTAVKPAGGTFDATKVSCSATGNDVILVVS
jgi:hypothetical protein